MNKTNDIFAKIENQYNKLSAHVDNAVVQTKDGWNLPPTQLAIVREQDNPWDHCDPCSKQSPLFIEPITWKGDDFAEFESVLSKHLFYTLCDYFTPENKLWAVYKKNPDVDGDEGCISDEKHFLKIGQAMKYAQELIAKYFCDKTKVIKFPDVERRVPTRCFDEGAYASSVAIAYKKIG